PQHRQHRQCWQQRESRVDQAILALDGRINDVVQTMLTLLTQTCCGAAANPSPQLWLRQWFLRARSVRDRKASIRRRLPGRANWPAGGRFHERDWAAAS